MDIIWLITHEWTNRMSSRPSGFYGQPFFRDGESSSCWFVPGVLLTWGKPRYFQWIKDWKTPPHHLQWKTKTSFHLNTPCKTLPRTRRAKAEAMQMLQKLLKLVWNERHFCIRILGFSSWLNWGWERLILIILKKFNDICLKSEIRETSQNCMIRPQRKGILDSMGCISHFKAQDSGFHSESLIDTRLIPQAKIS